MDFTLKIFLLTAGFTLVVAVQQHDDGALKLFVNTNATSPSVGIDGCSSTCRWQTFGPCQHPDEENNICFNMTEQMWCPVGSIECGVVPVESGPEVYFVPKDRTPVASSSAAASVTPVASSSAAASVTPVASSSAAVSVTPVASSSAAVSVTRVASSSATVSVTPSTSRPANIVTAPSGRLVANHLVSQSVMMPQDNYRISFDLNVSNYVYGNFAGIFQFAASGRSDLRLPALWFYPASTRFHWVMANGIYGQQEVLSSYAFNLHQNYHVDLQMLNSVGTIWVNGELTNGNGQTMHGLSGSYDCQLYMAVPGYPAADATVSNFMVTEL